MAVPVLSAQGVLGYIFHGVDGESGSAGTLQLSSSKRAEAATLYWESELARLHAQGVPAAEAVKSLIGRTSPQGESRVEGDLQRYENKGAVDQLLHPEAHEHRRQWWEQHEQMRAAREPSRPVSDSREQVDAALRGQLPMTSAVAAAVENLDSALATKPVPEAIVVTVLWRRSDLPAALDVGVRVHEAAYMLSYLVPEDHAFADAEVRMILRVEAGVPALFQEPRDTSRPPMLMLGRGIEWELIRTVELPEQLAIFARTVGVRASAVTPTTE